jgi:hypothetical protein
MDFTTTDCLIFTMVELELIIEKLQKNKIYFDVSSLKKVQLEYEQQYDRIMKEQGNN